MPAAVSLLVEAAGAGFACGGSVGCLTGLGSFLLRRRASATDGLPGKGGRSPPQSPGTKLRMLMSPPSRPARDPDKSLAKVSGDVSLCSSMADLGVLGGMQTEMDKESFIELLRDLIAQSKHVQNNPRMGVTPEERRTAEPVLKTLEPFSKKWGGVLEVEELEYVEGRPNIKVTYPGKTKKTVGFIGSHLDVVPADPETWERDPFQLSVEGDKLYGRGTTDCLGHVAMLTELLCKLAATKPPLQRSIVVIFIAAEEGGESGVGVDMCLSRGKLAELKNGPVYWVDSADSQPCCGTAGAMQWQLKAKGRLFHSGLPHRAINSIELASEAMRIIQDRFYDDFPPRPEEEALGFATGSTMKPTQVACAPGSTNQICLSARSRATSA